MLVSCPNIFFNFFVLLLSSLIFIQSDPYHLRSISSAQRSDCKQARTCECRIHLRIGCLFHIKTLFFRSSSHSLKQSFSLEHLKFGTDNVIHVQGSLKKLLFYCAANYVQVRNYWLVILQREAGGACKSYLKRPNKKCKYPIKSHDKILRKEIFEIHDFWNGPWVHEQLLTWIQWNILTQEV